VGVSVNASARCVAPGLVGVLRPGIGTTSFGQGASAGPPDPASSHNAPRSAAAARRPAAGPPQRLSETSAGVDEDWRVGSRGTYQREAAARQRLIGDQGDPRAHGPPPTRDQSPAAGTATSTAPGSKPAELPARPTRDAQPASAQRCSCSPRPGRGRRRRRAGPSGGGIPAAAAGWPSSPPRHAGQWLRSYTTSLNSSPSRSRLSAHVTVVRRLSEWGWEPVGWWTRLSYPVAPIRPGRFLRKVSADEVIW
jgi:hypothetical protein